MASIGYEPRMKTPLERETRRVWGYSPVYDGRSHHVPLEVITSHHVPLEVITSHHVPLEVDKSIGHPAGVPRS